MNDAFFLAEQTVEIVESETSVCGKLHAGFVLLGRAG